MLMEYRLRATMHTGESQQSALVRRVPLSDLSNVTGNVITSPQGSSLLKDRGLFSDSSKVSSTKRHLSDSHPSPHHPSTCNNVTNEHLVYVRRKLKRTVKVSTCDDVDLVITPKTREFNNSERKELCCQPDRVQDSRVSCSPTISPLAAASVIASSPGASVPALTMPTTEFLSVETNCPVVSCGAPLQDNSPGSNRVRWKERFLRLQMFLHSCDQSNQEEYIQMLRSLTAVGRSKHAVELEKRTIRLLLDEGKELHRMKLLNVLGKDSPDHVKT